MRPNTWVLILSGVLCLAAAALTTYAGLQLHEQRRQHAALEAAVAELQHELGQHLDQQTAVLHRALGDYIPVKVPAPVLLDLERFESRLADRAAWPKSAPEAEALRHELDLLVKRRLPPWAEEELLPRLNVVRWGVQALWTVQHDQAASDDRAEVVLEDYRTLAEAAPDGAG